MKKIGKILSKKCVKLISSQKKRINFCLKYQNIPKIFHHILPKTIQISRIIDDMIRPYLKNSRVEIYLELYKITASVAV